MSDIPDKPSEKPKKGRKPPADVDDAALPTSVDDAGDEPDMPSDAVTEPAQPAADDIKRAAPADKPAAKKDIPAGEPKGAPPPQPGAGSSAQRMRFRRGKSR